MYFAYIFQVITSVQSYLQIREIRQEFDVRLEIRLTG